MCHLLLPDVILGCFPPMHTALPQGLLHFSRFFLKGCQNVRTVRTSAVLRMPPPSLIFPVPPFPPFLHSFPPLLLPFPFRFPFLSSFPLPFSSLPPPFLFPFFFPSHSLSIYYQLPSPSLSTFPPPHTPASLPFSSNFVKINENRQITNRWLEIRLNAIWVTVYRLT